MARSKKIATHESPSPTWEEPVKNAPPPASVYDTYADVSFKDMVQAHENMRAHLKRTLQAFDTLENIIKRERIEVENVLAATQVT